MKLPNFTVKYATVLYCAALLAAWLCVGDGSAQAATLHAANNGVDSGTCGAAATPCRSISKTISHAAAGDTILVGPGIYGDIVGDSAFSSDGEEAAEVGFGCDCMIKVDKPLTIISVDGADATILDVGATSIAGVRIQTGGVTFGQQRRGFTIWRAGDAGLIVDSKASQVKISGNIAKFNGLNCRSGCTIPPGPGPGFDVAGNNNDISGNHAADNIGSGFEVSGSDHRLTGNLATQNGGAGYFVQGTNHTINRNTANNSGGSAFAFEGTNFTVTGNAGGASGGGFLIGGSNHTIKGNVASGNGSFGFEVFSPGTTLTRNAARGNFDGGVLLTVDATVTGNNFYGNNDGPSSGYALVNCGLLNDTGGPVTATNNFWGAATGPGANPADDVCNTASGGTTTTAPFATSEITVPVFPSF